MLNCDTLGIDPDLFIEAATMDPLDISPIADIISDSTLKEEWANKLHGDKSA